MKNFFQYLWQKIKEFFINPFWASWVTILLIIISLGLNFLVWYLWWHQYQELIGPVPIGYSSAVIMLNIFLANLAYRKEFMVSAVLLSIGLLVQIIYLIFIRFFAMSYAF